MKKGLIIGGSILGVILICLLVFLSLPFKINLNGESIIKLNYQDEYKEPGAYLTKLGIRFNKEIKIDSNVNINTLGEYIVTYKYKDIEKTRKVIVTDLKKPDIERTKGDINIFVNEEEYKKYKERGQKYKALHYKCTGWNQKEILTSYPIDFNKYKIG